MKKKDIKQYYADRDKLNPGQIERLFCSDDILSSTDEKFNDGVKLCTYLLLEKIGAQKAWDELRKIVVLNNPSLAVCNHIGTVLRRAYRDALRSTPSEGIVTRTDVANFIFKPLMEHCILVKRHHAAKFSLILRGATFDRDEAMSKMIFEVSTSVVWRYLTATNAYVRLGAYYVQLNVFPPSADDQILMADYFNKHCDAFLHALKDPCVEICLQAIEGVCEIVSTYFDMIPEEYIDKIFKAFVALADDDSAKIRSSLYYGLRHFHECAIGVLKFGELLKKICKRGIDDPSEHVRCNTFRLLNAMKGSKIIVVTMSKSLSERALLSIEDVLYRLDFEESEAIEREIGRLLFTNIFERDISNENRYNFLNKMCRINRNACLDLHRLLNSIEVTNTQGTLSHLSSILTVCVPMLKMIITERNEDASQADGMDTSDAQRNETAVQNRTGAHVDVNKHLERLKNVTDCMVVCFAAMRYDPVFDATMSEAQVVARFFSEIANEIITYFESNGELLDTALSIIALVRNAGIHSSKIKKTCTLMLRSGRCNARYLEIFGLIAMDELLQLLQNGLAQLESSLFDVENTPQRKRAAQANEFLHKKSVIEALMTLLNLPSCNQYVVEKYLHYVSTFIKHLQRICENFMANLQRNAPIDMELFLSCWNLWTIFLVLRHNRQVFVDSGDKIKGKFPAISRPARRRSAVILSSIDNEANKDPMIGECEWLKAHLEESPELAGNADLIEHFYKTIELHLQAYKHVKNSVDAAIDYVKEVHEMGNDYSRNRGITQACQSCIKSGKHALEFAVYDSVVVE